jgi:hypothetical protein
MPVAGALLVTAGVVLLLYVTYGIFGRLVGSAVLILAAAALLWFWVFPTADGLLPFDDVRVTDDQPAVTTSQR